MLKFIQNRKNKKKGFTLIELIVVIAILGILAAILVPSIMGYVADAKLKKDKANAQQLFTATKASLALLESSGTAVSATVGDTSFANTDTDNLVVKVKAHLGSTFSAAFSITLTDATQTDVSTVTYNGVAYP